MDPRGPNDDPASSSSLVDEALGRAADARGERLPEETRRALAGELLEAALRGGADPPWRAELPAAETAGRRLAEAGEAAADVAREIAALVAAVEDALDRRGPADADARRRLRDLGAEATARALVAHAAVQDARRDGWLSYYAHEMRNPLNTLVNAVWLLRNTEQANQLPRICDMAERSLKRLGATIQAVRQLDRVLTTPPPPKPGKA